MTCVVLVDNETANVIATTSPTQGEPPCTAFPATDPNPQIERVGNIRNEESIPKCLRGQHLSITSFAVKELRRGGTVVMMTQYGPHRYALLSDEAQTPEIYCNSTLSPFLVVEQCSSPSASNIISASKGEISPCDRQTGAQHILKRRCNGLPRGNPTLRLLLLLRLLNLLSASS